MSMSKEMIQEDISLTIRDRVDWPYLISYSINTLFLAMRRDTLNEWEIQTIVEYIEGLIPMSIRLIDKKYEEELKAATKDKKLDKRPHFGGVPLSEEACKLQGIVPYEMVKVVPPVVKFNAIINLLNRLGVVTKKEYTEKFTGRRATPEMEVYDPEKGVA
jgi:hypothetical protein